MKNHNEFRRTVFEKARQYKARKTAHRQKLVQVFCLCTVVFSLVPAVYFLPMIFSYESTETVFSSDGASESMSDIIEKESLAASVFVTESDTTFAEAQMTVTADGSLETTGTTEEEYSFHETCSLTTSKVSDETSRQSGAEDSDSREISVQSTDMEKSSCTCVSFSGRVWVNERG